METREASRAGKGTRGAMVGPPPRPQPQPPPQPLQLEPYTPPKKSLGKVGARSGSRSEGAGTGGMLWSEDMRQELQG